MYKRLGIIFFLSLLFLLFLSGCSSKRAAVKVEETLPEFQTISEKDITLSVRYLNEDNLISLFGERNNPYLMIGFNRLVVFEIQTSSEREIYIHLKMIEVQFAGKSKVPIDRFRLSELWKTKIDTQGGGPNDRYKGWGSANVIKRINETMAPNKMKAHPGREYSALVVFMGRLPRYGSVTLFVPVWTLTGELIHNFRFEIELLKDKL